MWLGSFVCEGCSIAHLNLPYGSQSKSYVKNIFKEHWDDYQLRSIALGGNKPLFELLKEYEIQDLEFNKKYKHAAVRWYIRKHLAEMDGFQCGFDPPAKNMKERKERLKSETDKTLARLDGAIDSILDASVVAS